MQKITGEKTDSVLFGSNCLRLSPGEWLVEAVLVTAVVLSAPLLWQRVENFEPGPDYRLPYGLSNDYWLYQRYADRAAEKYDTLVIGDSVVWGHYVSKDNTLSAHLNRLVGEEKFANLGVDGIHPAALEGLLRYYGRPIENKNVILHLNLLWMSSPKHDLQTEKEHRFNHPELAAQFTPKIPCYKASWADRMSIAVKRVTPLFNWMNHLNIAYFGNMDVPAWTVAHPYDCPFEAVTAALPSSDDYERDAKAAKPTGNNALDWVDLNTSLQWKFFKRSTELLKQRGNKVFILLGPFNEHLLTAESIDKYRKMQTEIAAWLKQNNIPYDMPPVLNAELYSDASHPLSEGYAKLAKRLIENRTLNTRTGE
ncbi:MAG: hypothetical protein JXN61_04075 [Sedimentisphaerales bacterium]|nr:hypothetical protein [Sedimentisphaerales bacterium]